MGDVDSPEIGSSPLCADDQRRPRGLQVGSVDSRQPPLAYIAAKFAGTENRAELEQVVAAVEASGWKTSWFVRDVENWASFWSDNQAIMAVCMSMIEASDLVFAEISDKGVGVGWECGYAAGLGKPVVAAARKGSDLSPNLAAVVDVLTIYEEPQEVTAVLTEALRKIRHRTLDDA